MDYWVAFVGLVYLSNANMYDDIFFSMSCHCCCGCRQIYFLRCFIYLLILHISGCFVQVIYSLELEHLIKHRQNEIQFNSVFLPIRGMIKFCAVGLWISTILYTIAIHYLIFYYHVPQFNFRKRQKCCLELLKTFAKVSSMCLCIYV